MTNHSLKGDITLIIQDAQGYIDDETIQAPVASKAAEAIIAKCLEHLPEKYSEAELKLMSLSSIGKAYTWNHCLDQITSEWSKI